MATGTSLDVGADGADRQLGEPEPSLQAGEGEPGSARSGRDDRRRPAALDRREQEPAPAQAGDTLLTALLDGSYQPQPVRGVEIPKPGGGKRQLGIPTVVDRLVQQAILQVLEPLLDPSFSASSFGFRPGRGAHEALLRARDYVADGYDVVVDLDLEKFFDRVNHDVLMSRLARRIGDRRLLQIIRRFLAAGMMRYGVSIARREGTPQSLPLRRQGAVRCRRCSPICCWMIWTRNSKAAATGSAAASVLGPAKGRTRGPTTATSMCGRRQPGNGSWPR